MKLVQLYMFVRWVTCFFFLLLLLVSSLQDKPTSISAGMMPFLIYFEAVFFVPSLRLMISGLSLQNNKMCSLYSHISLPVIIAIIIIIIIIITFIIIAIIIMAVQTTGCPE